MKHKRIGGLEVPRYSNPNYEDVTLYIDSFYIQIHKFTEALELHGSKSEWSCIKCGKSQKAGSLYVGQSKTCFNCFEACFAEIQQFVDAVLDVAAFHRQIYDKHRNNIIKRNFVANL